MSRRWQISVLGAVACHLAVLFGFHITLTHPARLARETAVEVSLVAAPVPVVPMSKPAPPVEQVPIPKPLLPPEMVKPSEPVIQAVKPAEVVVKEIKHTNAPAPVVLPNRVAVNVVASTPPQVTGDGSSRQPGIDETTRAAQVGVRAEPNYLKNPEPPYPLAARRRRETGVVLLTVKVTAQGRAAKVDLKQSSGHPLLDDAAAQAVRDWEFQPARVGSVAVESEIEVPVRFKLTP